MHQPQIIESNIQSKSSNHKEMDPNGRESKRKRPEIEEPKIRTMEIVKGMENDEELVVIETKIISQLIQNIEDEKVKTLIECFNPVIRNSTDYIKEQMLDCSDKWENRKEIFMGAISYIIHSRQDKYKEEQLKEMETDRLSEILTTEIENRMPTYCRKCEEWYIVQFNDQPEMHCMWCRVGIHDCEEMNEMNKYPGMKWLCTKCEPIFIKHFLPKLDQFSLFQGFSPNENTDKISKVVKETKKNNGEKTGVVEAIEVDESDDDEDDDNEDDDNDSNNNDNNDNGTNNDNRNDEDNQANNSNDDDNNNSDTNQNNLMNNNRNQSNNNNRPVTSKDVCWYWKNRKCKYTTNCKEDHPEQCKEMLELGLCKDSRCKRLHPKICRNLFFNKYCPRGDTCWFVHPSKIKNNVLNNQNTQNPYNNLNNRRNSDNINNHPRHNNQNQYMNQRNEYANVNKNFLEIYHPPQNNWSQIVNQNQPMNQMMQNMLEKITRMESKMLQMEMARTFNYH